MQKFSAFLFYVDGATCRHTPGAATSRIGNFRFQFCAGEPKAGFVYCTQHYTGDGLSGK
jgi:hypothetical protein